MSMTYFKRSFLFGLLIFPSIFLFGQANTCVTADVLCSLSELDGFSGTMPEMNNTGEFPQFGLCPGGGTNQNITWFGFIAGSTSATLELTFTNCDPGSGVTPEIQYGVYTDCSFDEAVICVSNAVPATIFQVTISPMVPGDDYFFFIDGDQGTFCDYEIDVISGGEPVPVPQPTAVNCISSNCPADGNVCATGETFTFEPDGLDLSIDYIWTVTPSPPNGTTINGDNDFSATFNAAGMYEICVTGDNGCTQTTPVCYTLNVLEADAGMLEADPETLCPGETSTVAATGYIDSPPVEQAVIAVDPNGIVIGVEMGATIDVTHSECGVITVYSYNYNPADSPVVPNIGDSYTIPNCSNSCCDTESIEVNFEDSEPPVLSNTPSDITLDCNESIPTMNPADWTDNCDGSGMVDGVQEDNYDVCMGGTITRTWTFADGCMNEAEYIQTITINAQNGGTFDSEPANMTFDCEADIPPPMNLNWTGDCEGTTVVIPVDSGDADLCAGGQVVRTWSYNDPCGGLTEHVQTFTINPASAGEFLDPPANTMTLCDQSDLTPMTDLIWMGDCEGTAMVVGTEDVNVDACSGGTITRFWTYTDGCGAVTEHTQIITVAPPPLAEAIDPPPPNTTINCDEIPPNFPILSFTNGQTGDCSIMGTADPEVMGDPTICGGSISIVWVYTDPCFNVSSYVQNITILPAAEPEFIDPPADMTISCIETFPTPEDLNYTNNQTGACEISGSIQPLVTTEGDICGGDVISIWEFTDECGVVHSHTQTIIIESLAEPEFIDPPEDITVSCANGPGIPVSLNYTNNEMGGCEIMGSVDPTTDGTYDVCGGAIANTWEFTDLCGRTFTHVQTITIELAPEPVFITLPADMTIGCDEIPPTPPSLNYENGGTATCEIMGSIDPSVNDNSNSCGGEIEYTWQFTDPCGRVISHTQLITIEEAPAPIYTSMPADVTVNCGELPSPAESLDYTNGDPCEIMGSVDPIIDDNNDICGGEIINTWDFTDECGRQLIHIQTITINPAPEAEFQDIPLNNTVACGDDVTNSGDLQYTNNGGIGCLISGSVPAVQSGSYNACGGEILFTWEFTDECMRVIQHVQTIVVEPASQASFIDMPADITVSCADFNSTPPLLSYSNNESDLCEISGSVPGAVIGNPNPCGVDVTYRWEFIDDCGRTITYNQLVTIEEAPEASFINPPGDITQNCDEVSTTIPLLNYSNSATGICQISGSVVGIQSGFYNECGGDITYTWTFTDDCNRTIAHSQSITVNPAQDPMFIDTPTDITLSCGEDFPIDPPLDYTNNSTGICTIDGTVIAISSVDGAVTSYTWSFTNDCNGNMISHTQNVTGVSTPDISIDPQSVSICIGDDFDLSTVVVTDANGNPFTTSFEDSSGNPLGSSIVSPTSATTYTIVATNDSDCSDQATFTINVDEPGNAGLDGAGKVCGTSLTYNLFDYLNGTPDPGGTWFDTGDTGVNIDNPFSVNFTGIASGVYQFTYIVFSSNSCPDATAVAEIEVIAELEFEILSIECASGGVTYTINVFPNGNNIFSSLGDVTVIDENNVTVTNIPAGELVVISAIDQDAFCITDIFVNPPDCDCPEVNSPISGGDVEICEGEEIPELSVSVGAGFTVNWYGDQTSTDPIATMTNTYTPSVSAPGVYAYYVEAVDENGCVSLIRTLVILTINAVPTIENIDTSFCTDENGNVIIDLQTLNSMINGNANFTFFYYESMDDAENGMNPLDNNYATNTSIVIFAVTTNTSGCLSISEVQIVANPLPSFTIEMSPEICFGDGDGSISIVDIIPSNVEFSLDNFDFNSSVTIGSLAFGDYTLYARSDAGCLSSQPFTMTPGIQLDYSNLMITCNDNGTSFSSSDDFYEIQFEVSNNLGSGGMVQISSDTEDFGVFSYGLAQLSIGAGAMVELIILDTDTGCNISMDLGLLSPCSTSCNLTIDQLMVECDGNGTSTDPNDDTYTITINASVVNGASNNTFNVLVDGNIVANFEYGIGGEISIPAQGQNVVITLADNEDSQCFSTENIGPLTPCSSECIITIDNQNFMCDNNETIGISDDDTYDFIFTVLSTNSSSVTYTLLVNGNNVGTFNYGELSNYELPADGSTPTLEFVDNNDADCNIMIIAPELNSCSGSCTVTATLESTLCFNENTSDDPSDDTFTAVISIDLVGGTSMWQIVSSGETGTSGQMVTVGPFLISDGIVVLEIIDPGISDCSTILQITPSLTCSVCEETVEAGVNVELDCDVTEANLVGESSVAGDGIWTGPGGFSENGYEATVDVPGIYYFTVDFGDSCIRTDSLIISVSNDIPQVNIESPLSLTCLADSVLLSATVIGGSGNFTYQWTNDAMVVVSTNPEFMVGESGNYFLEVYDMDTDCTSPPKLLEVLDSSDLPSAIIRTDPGSVLDCVVEVIYLTTENGPNVEYKWFVNSVEFITEGLTIEDASMIELLAIDTITGCRDSSILMVTSLEEYPIVDLQSLDVLDCINGDVIIDGSASQNGANIEYTWLDSNGNVIGGANNTLTVEEAGYYYLQLVDTENNCTNIDSILVTSNFDFPQLTLNNEMEIRCDETNLEIQLSVNGDANDFMILWSTSDGSIVSGENNSFLNIDSPGSYFASVLNINNQCESFDTVIVNLPDLINESQLNILDESCDENGDGGIEIQSISGGTEPYMYYLDGTLLASPIAENLSEGPYLISVIDANGCTFDSMITVEVLDAFEIDLEASITLSAGEERQLNVNVNIPQDEIASIAWTPAIKLSCEDCLNPLLTASNQDEIYSIRITDINGCEAEASIQLLVENRVVIIAPNIFTPNLDNNENDNFTIYSNVEGVVINSLQIFDRWGNLVFDKRSFPTNDPQQGWDGRFGSKAAATGVYVFYSEIILPDGNIEVKKGDITIIK